MLATPGLRNYYLGNEHRNFFYCRTKLNSTKYRNAIVNFFKKVNMYKASQRKVIVPKDVQKLVRENGFNPKQQHDAFEIFGHLISQL